MSSLDSLIPFLKPSAEMPVLFVGHGNPMNAIDENQFVTGFRTAAAALPQPQAIICISAHWFTKGTRVTAMQQPRTIHDFYGFPQELFQQTYSAPGSPQLAQSTQALLRPDPVQLDHDWGFDHGTWTILKHMFPAADIPVIQLSIDYTKDPEYHFELANRLARLRNNGVLIIGSGNIIHNLGMVDFKNIDRDNYGFDWALEARETINNYMLAGDFKSLFNYKNLGQAMRLAIPTPEHYLPLMYSLGLKGKTDNIALFNDKLVAGSLSMTSVKIGK